MHKIYIEILKDVIREQFPSEQQFYAEYLQSSAEAWQQWQQDGTCLTNDQAQKIKNLFTDYEWMLIQKILRQALVFPEKRSIAVAEYKRLKTTIAKKWLQSGAGTAELLPTTEPTKKQSYIDLKVTMSYGEWGFDDIVTFRLPAKIQGQVTGSNVALLDWVNEKLMETYVTD